MIGYTENRVVCADGLNLYVRDYVPTDAIRGDPVLCLHGLTRNSKDFESVAPWLAGHGRRVLTLDIRGRGQSDWDPQPQRYQAATYAGDVIAVLSALGISRAVFLGTSMGGLITMILAALKPELITSAILNDIGPIIDPAGIKRIAAYAGNVGPFDTWQSLASQIRTLQGPFYPDADNEFWLTFARRCAKERGANEIVFDYDPAIAQATSATTAPAPDLMPYFAALAPKPILVVRGALSDILSVEGLAAMQGAKADLDVCEVARVGHAPTLEEPDAKVAIAAFLRKVA